MDGAQDKQPVRNRTRQACDNCRRKKVRCDGLQPICSFCRRLDQDCHYSKAASRRRIHGNQPSQDTSGLTYQQTLYYRIAQLECSLYPPEPPFSSGSHTQDSDLDLTSWLADEQSAFDFGTDPSSSKPEEPSSAEREMSAMRLEDEVATPLSVPPSFKSTPTPRAQPLDIRRVSTSDSSISWSVHDLDPQTLGSIIDAYFQNYHCQPYYFFHETRFRTKMQSGQVPHHLTSAIVASSLRFVQDNQAINVKIDLAHKLARESWNFISQIDLDDDEDYGLDIVQSATMLAIFDFVEGKQRNAWVKLGQAVRLAQALGLSFEPSKTLSWVDQEEFRRSFWSLYLLDRLATCGRDRPQSFDDRACTVQLPCSEEALRHNEPEKTEKLSTYTQGQEYDLPDPSPFARVIIVSSILSKCSQYAIQGFEADANIAPWDASSEYQRLSSSLLSLESQLQFSIPLETALSVYKENSPSRRYCGEPLIISYALYHLCHCLLNHFFLVRQRLTLCSKNPPQSFIQRLLDNNRVHASSLTQSLMDSLAVGCTVKASFIGYCSFMAALMHGVNCKSDDAQIRQSSEKHFKFSLQFLKRSRLYWPSFDLMYRLLEEFKEGSAVYTPFLSPHTTMADMNEAIAERMAYLTDYGSLSQARRPSTQQTPSVDSGVAVSGSSSAPTEFMDMDVFVDGESDEDSKEAVLPLITSPYVASSIGR